MMTRARSPTGRGRSNRFSLSVLRPSHIGLIGLIFLFIPFVYYSGSIGYGEFQSDAAADGMSGCLLIKDDNDRLPEWIAHHFTTSPLRTLIVATDPKSNVRPTEILRRWNGTDGFVIHEWDDEDYMTPAEQKQIADMIADVEQYEDLAPLRGHQIRQIVFIKQCLSRLKKMGKTWTMHIDTDEYLTFNPKSFPEPNPPLTFHPYVEWAVESNYRLDMKKTESIRIKEWDKLGHDIEDGIRKYNPPKKKLADPSPAESKMIDRSKKVAKVRARIPKVGDATIMDFIRLEEKNVPFSDRSGFFVPRLLFSSKPSSAKLVKSAVPHGFDAFKFDTLRFRKHAPKGMHLHNKHGKSILDVSKLTDQSYIFRYMHEHSRATMNIHNLVAGGKLTDMFKTEEGFKSMLPYNQALFRVHHYVGSEESFNSKEDNRRSLDKYSFAGRNDFKVLYEDDDIRPWVKSFVSKVGAERAHFLLAGAADPAMNTKDGLAEIYFKSKQLGRK